MTGHSDESRDASPRGGWLWLEDDLTFEDLDPVHTWRTDLERAERAGQTDVAKRLRKAGPPPGFGAPPQAFAPVVVSVEVGGDPGGALAVALAALESERLSLVIVVGGAEPARFTRHLLDLMGRPEVMVAASSAPSTQDLCIDGLTPPQVSTQTTDVAGSVRAVTGLTQYLVLWGNSGPLNDLAAALADDPALPDRLEATIAAGPLDDSGSPPFASDAAAAMTALATLRQPPMEAHDPRAAVRPTRPPWLITADPRQVTLHARALLRQALASPGAPAWAALLGQHLGQWFARGHPESSLYPVLTVATLVGRPFIQPVERPVIADHSGRVRIDPGGTAMAVTQSLRTWLSEFDDWLDRRFREAIESETPE